MTRLLKSEKDFLKKASKLLRRVQDDLGKRTPESKSFTSVQFMVCFDAILHNQPTISELVDSIGTSTSTLYKTIEKLEGLGYCEKYTDPEDARLRRLRVTPKFERLIRDVFKEEEEDNN